MIKAYYKIDKIEIYNDQFFVTILWKEIYVLKLFLTDLLN